MKGLKRQLPEPAPGPEPEEKPDPYCAQCNHTKETERLKEAFCGSCEAQLQKLMSREIFGFK